MTAEQIIHLVLLSFLAIANFINSIDYRIRGHKTFGFIACAIVSAMCFTSFFSYLYKWS